LQKASILLTSAKEAVSERVVDMKRRGLISLWPLLAAYKLQIRKLVLNAVT